MNEPQRILLLSLLILLFLHVTCLLGSEFTFEELKQINGSCHSRGGCQGDKVYRAESVDWKEANCFCDESCIEYGDCCLQAKNYNRTKMAETVNKYECVNVNLFRSYYMIGTCKENWSLDVVKDLCLKATPGPRTTAYHDDPLIDVPVTRMATNTTYKNYFCAVCNNEVLSDLQTWSTKVSCPDAVNISESNHRENLKFYKGSWGVFLNTTGEPAFHTCHILPEALESIVPKIRRCQTYTTTCAPNWSNNETEYLCHSYTNVVYDLHNRNTYRNYHCAKCNFVDVKGLECKRDIVLYSQKPVSLSVLFDFGAKETSCPIGRMWDPFSKQCRPVVCMKKNHEYRYGKCVKVTENVVDLSINSTEIENFNVTDSSPTTERNWTSCDKMLLNETDFTKMANFTIYVNESSRIYTKDEYEVEEDGVLICIPDDNSSFLLGWLTLFGLGLSSISLLIHLSVFVIAPDFRNLSDKNLASLCTALLAAYVCFLFNFFRKGDTDGCQSLASAMYYYLLASFMWMNVMSFDVWRALMRATSKLRVTAGEQWKKFVYYSIYAWTIPAVALTIVRVIDYFKPEFPHGFLPELGENSCWFGQDNAILVYFAAPLALIMTMNIIFFLMAVRTLTITSNSRSSLTATHPNQVQLKLYIKLAILMGLSWVSGIVAGFIQNNYVWYMFILLNAFQGLYILIAFTCTDKVRKVLTDPNFKAFRATAHKKTSTSSATFLASQDNNNSHYSSASTASINSTFNNRFISA